MRLIDSPVVQREAAAMAPADRQAFLASIRYDGFADDLATNMRILLRIQGCTQREVAERMGTSETALSRLLKGKAVRRAKLDTFIRFAKAIGVDVLDVFDDVDVVVQRLNTKRLEAVAVDRPQPSTVVWIDNLALGANFGGRTVTYEAKVPTPPIVIWATA
jgi:transcriptional regulator with XRE-family HTH domain